MIPKSIKWRLQIWYGLILVVVLAGFGFTAYQLERGRLVGRIDDELHRRVGILANALHITGFRSFSVRLRTARGRPLFIFVCIWRSAPFLQCTAHPDQVIQFTPAHISDNGAGTLGAVWILGKNEGGSAQPQALSSLKVSIVRSLGSELCRQCLSSGACLRTKPPSR